MKRPEIHYQDLVELADIGCHSDPSISSQVEILVKYSGYIDRQTDEIKKLKKNEQVRLPTDIDYSKIVGLSNEVKQKLLDHRPETISQVSRISGVTPAAVSLLLVYLKKLELSHPGKLMGLVDGLNHLGLSYSKNQLISLQIILNEHLKWNKVYNLSAHRNEKSVLIYQILDSLTPHEFIREETT